MELLKKHKLFLVLAIVLATIFFVRIFYTINISDECFNIGEAYRMVLGQTSLVEIWDLFQTGDLFLVPFVWIFYTFTGSTDGIVLFVRLSYFIINLGLAVFLYKILSKRTDSLIAACIGLCTLTFAPFSLYYPWYDTFAVIFMLIGCLLLMYGAYAKKSKSKTVALVAAGIFHACMIYSYPTMIIAIFVLFCIFVVLQYKKYKNIKGVLNDCKWYIAGAAGVLLIFLIYCLCVGFNNLFFLDSDIMSFNMSRRSVPYTFIGVLTAIQKTFVTLLNQMDTIALPTGVLIVFFVFSLIKKKNSKPLNIIVLLGIVILPLLCNLTAESVATINYMFYIFIWAPALCLYLKDKEHRETAKKLILFLWIPSLFSMIAVEFTAMNGGIKTEFGCYAGAVAAFAILGMAAKEQDFKIPKTAINIAVSSVVLLSLAASQTYLYWNNVFQYSSIDECTYRVESGIFKGIYAAPKDTMYEKMQDVLNSVIDDEDETILCTDVTIYVYLFSSLKPCTAYLWRPYAKAEGEINDWSMTYEYFEKTGKTPDVIVSATTTFPNQPDSLKYMINTKYKVATQTGGMIVYKRK